MTLHAIQFTQRDVPVIGTGTLGPKQLAWLEANVPGFATVKKQADAALAHTAETAAVMPAPEEKQS